MEDAQPEDARAPAEVEADAESPEAASAHGKEAEVTAGLGLSAAAPGATEDAAPPVCRICRGSADETPLLRPCNCAGSMGYAHEQCEFREEQQLIALLAWCGAGWLASSCRSNSPWARHGLN